MEASAGELGIPLARVKKIMKQSLKNPYRISLMRRYS